ncbi:hypothetical protein MBAV_003894 [Candidatus Magnetobacterium bavaricum]|uniref:Uncharacterized protein n=1 Tax=Candidatus Magnetobacterium bavaricum TaxID=29290 RepID=A0A0F3GTB3_9BACT|nr:hypothetical protein MBAV_003894 [Candidatus Magnetobacterium bavaricum]
MKIHNLLLKQESRINYNKYEGVKGTGGIRVKLRKKWLFQRHTPLFIVTLLT